MKHSIGISCQLDSVAGFYGNSIRQAAIFLGQILDRQGHNVKYLAGITPDSIYGTGMLDYVQPYQLDDGTGEFDVVIEVSRYLSIAELQKHASRGARTVKYIASNQALFGLEAAVGGDQKAADSYESDRMNFFSEVWLQEGYESYKTWAELMYKRRVTVVPMLWLPHFTGSRWSTEPPKNAYRIGIMEPNNSVDRTCLFPLQAIACMSKLESVGQVLVTNVDQLKSQQVASWFNQHLSVVGPEIRMMERPEGPAFLKNDIDLLLTHNLCSGLKMTHCEALYFGKPLVHTVPALREAELGYFWNRCDPQDGGKALDRAIVEDGEDLRRKQSCRFVRFMEEKLQDSGAYEALL